MNPFLNLLSYIAMFAPVLPSVVGLSRVRRLRDGQRLLLLLLVFYLINQGIAEWFSAHEISNLPLFHLHVAVEFVLLFWIYFVERGVFHNRRFQIIFSVAFIVAGILNTALGEGLWNPPSIFLVIESGLFILLVTTYFWKVFKEMRVIHIEREFLFWISLGVLIFFAGTLLVSAFMDFLTFRKDIYFEVFSTRYVLIILTNICYAIAMLCKAHPQKS